MSKTPSRTKPAATKTKPQPATKSPSKPAAKAERPPSKAVAKAELPPSHDPLTEWASSCLQRAKGLASDVVARPAGLDAAVGRVFGLDEMETSLLQLVHAVERSWQLAQETYTLGGLTVELARAALDAPGLDAELGPARALRRYALVVTEGEGAVGAHSMLTLGPGLLSRLEGRVARAELGAGIYRLGPTEIAALVAGADQRLPPLANEISVQEDTPRICTLANCGRKEALVLAAILAQRLQRGLTFVDGDSLKLLGPAWRTLAAARRDADLDGEVLVLAEAVAVGEAWRAAASLPATLAPRAAIFIVADSATPRDLFLLPGWRYHTYALQPATSATVDKSRPVPADDGLDHVRQLAVRDAERALGIVRAAPPAPRPTVAGTVSSSGLQEQRAPLPPVAAEPVGAVIVAPKAAEPPPPPTPPKRGKRSAKAIAMFGPDPNDVEEPPPKPAAPVAMPIVLPPPPSELSPELVAAEATPYVEVAENAAVPVLAKIALSSPNPRQRAEILTALLGIKDPGAMAAMRTNASSAHPTLRAVAEAGMARLFGPTWNQSRAVPKPVQPPTDGKDRGPPGGY